MNRLLERLDRDGTADLDSLKRLYRALCKASHPDLGMADGGKTFLWLKAEYESARTILASRSAVEQSQPKSRSLTHDKLGASDPLRNDFLDALGLYADFLDGLGGDCFASRPPAALAEGLIAGARAYDEPLGSLFEEYFEFLGIRLGRMLRYARSVTAFRCLWNALIAFTRWRRRGFRSDRTACETWCGSILFDPVFGEPGDDSLGAVELFDRVGQTLSAELAKGR